MARGSKKQVPIVFEKTKVPSAKLTREGIAADKAAAVAAVREGLRDRGAPSPGKETEPDAANWWSVGLPSGGAYKVPWYADNLRGWLRALSVPTSTVAELIPKRRQPKTPVISEKSATPPKVWPDALAVKKAKVFGAADTIPVVKGSLKLRGIAEILACVGPKGGDCAVKSKGSKYWARAEWEYGQAPIWFWVEGPAAKLPTRQAPQQLADRGLLKGRWEAVLEYVPDLGLEGRPPVQVTLRRKITPYATLFLQGPLNGGGWRYGYEKGRSAAKWWIKVQNWDEEGAAASMDDAIKLGLKALFSKVVGPSCTKRDTERPG